MGVGLLGYEAADLAKAEPAGAAVGSKPAPDERRQRSAEPTHKGSERPGQKERKNERQKERQKPTEQVDRAAVPVSVLNAGRTQGLAAQVGTRVRNSGWQLAGVGNWRGAPGAVGVYYPPGRAVEARQLARDLGLGASAPAIQGMAADRLTVVVSGR